MKPDERHTLDDEAQLQALGHKGELKRNFSLLSMLGLAFAILNSWTALSSSIGLALPSGGSTSVIWGLVTAGICNLCLAASLAEFLSAYPTAGGQYHWVAVITPRKWVPLASFITGWINVSGWLALTTSGGLLASQLISGLIALYHPDFTLHPWQVWLIYVAWTIIAFIINAFMNNLLPYVNRGAFIWSIGGFAIVCITVLACSSPEYASAEFVFTEFINETGWPDGIAWLLGLLQGGFGLTGYDAVAHMIEEIPNAAVEGPKIMIYCVCIGTVTGFIFLMVLLFVSGGDAESIISAAPGPLLQILYNATSSRAGAACLLMFPLVCILFAETAIMTTSSRMTYAFARDGGLPFSKFFAKVHPRLGQPLNALILAATLTILFGLILIGSSSAFNALISASVVALGVSYAIPVAINVCRGRKMLGPRAFVLPGPFGWIANLIGIAYTIVTTVLFLFPPELPVSASSMNYCVVAFGIILFISTFQWFVDGRKNFTGPRADVGLEVLEAMKSHEPNDATAQHFKDVDGGKDLHEMESLNANAPEKPNDIPTKAASSQISGSPSTSNSNSNPAYRAAFNSGAPLTQFAKKASHAQPSSIAPNSALSGYLFSRVKGTGASNISDIPPPQIPLYPKPVTTRAGQRTNDRFTESEDIDMPDADFRSPPTPSTTRPGGDNAHHLSNKSSQNNGKDTAAASVSSEPSDTDSSTSVDRNSRPQSIPVRQQDRQQTPTTPQTKEDWLDDIVIEEDTPENNLPVGYLGTFRGSRHFIPEYPGMLPCSHNTKHHLLCGHWISSSEPCGSNCKKQNHAEKPFNCPTCQGIVREALTGSILSAVESIRLRKLKEKGNSIVYVSCCVGQVVRAAPQIKSGVTEAVAGLLLEDYGRKCEQADNPDPEGLETIEWIVRDMQERTERKQRERFAQENPLNTHDKRKSYEDAMYLSVNEINLGTDRSATQDKQPRGSSSTGEDDKQDALSASKKRQKTKLENHREPTTPQGRGTKRPCPSTSSSDGNVSPFASVAGSKRIKTPMEKVYTPPSSTFGEASFPSPNASVIGAMKRKHWNDGDLDGGSDVLMKSGFKRCRVEIWRASQERVKMQMSGFAGFAAARDEDKDDF
ncbi:unnamed protein product [Alternaria sp. RS040]